VSFFSVYFEQAEELYFLVKTYVSLYQCRNVGAYLFPRQGRRLGDGVALAVAQSGDCVALLISLIERQKCRGDPCGRRLGHTIPLMASVSPC
jgi:hypothetical protein